MQVQLRETIESDLPAISDVVIAAFGAREGEEIAHLIAALSADPSARPLHSLVAALEGRVVGHILFTHAKIGRPSQAVSAAILAPLAVHPEFQSQGIGAQLIAAGLKALSAAGTDLIFVLGHPDYYPKHGFSPAGEQGFAAPFSIPPEHANAWMVQALRPGIIGRVRGQVVCADSLDDPKYWRE